MGIGAAPEGVLTAAALRCLGGEIQARFKFRNEEERERAREMCGIDDEEHVFTTEELASGDNLVFAATGVTDGEVLKGVRFFGGGARTHSIVMAYRTKQVRFVDTVHMFDRNRPPSVRVIALARLASKRALILRGYSRQGRDPARAASEQACPDRASAARAPARRAIPDRRAADETRAGCDGRRSCQLSTR